MQLGSHRIEFPPEFRDRCKRVVLPSIFTLLNATCGFLSLIAVLRGNLRIAAELILVAAVMDFFDGRVARFMGGGSDIGAELDSLADVISFCLAPAFFVYSWQLHILGGVGTFGAIFFLAMGIVRLARFNVCHASNTNFFIGLPTTMAGCFIAELFLNFGHATGTLHPKTIMLVVLACALCMVGPAKFLSMKLKFSQFRKSALIVTAVSAAGLAIVFGLHAIVLSFFLAYLLGSLCINFIDRRYLRGITKIILK